MKYKIIQLAQTKGEINSMHNVDGIEIYFEEIPLIYFFIHLNILEAEMFEFDLNKFKLLCLCEVESGAVVCRGNSLDELRTITLTYLKR